MTRKKIILIIAAALVIIIILAMMKVSSVKVKNSFQPYDGKSFVYQSQPINPSCLDMEREEVARGGQRNPSSTTLSSCQNDSAVKQDGNTISVRYPFGEIYEYGGWAEYEVIGQRGDEFAVNLSTNDGGAQDNSFVEIMKKSTDSIKVVEVLSSRSGTRLSPSRCDDFAKGELNSDTGEIIIRDGCNNIITNPK